jgi:hypothetical protein
LNPFDQGRRHRRGGLLGVVGHEVRHGDVVPDAHPDRLSAQGNRFTDGFQVETGQIQRRATPAHQTNDVDVLTFQRLNPGNEATVESVVSSESYRLQS